MNPWKSHKGDEHHGPHEWHPRLRRAIWKSPDDGYWYVFETDSRGKILDRVDSVGWSEEKRKAKAIAHQTIRELDRLQQHQAHNQDATAAE